MTETITVAPQILHAQVRYPQSIFLPEHIVAPDDQSPIPIGFGQTMTAPNRIAQILSIADIQQHHNVLDVGTGSGYQSILISTLCTNVMSIDAIEPFTIKAQQHAQALNIDNITYKTINAYCMDKEILFDRIIVNAAVKTPPPVLRAILKPQGMLVIPIDKRFDRQRICTLETTGETVTHIASRFIGLSEPRKR